MSESSTVAPRTALILKIDTLGDLVVFAPVLRALRAEWPGTRLAVVIRRAYLDLAPLLAEGVEWWPTTLDPFAQGPEADTGETARLREAVQGLGPEVVVAATSRRNWLEAALGAAAPGARRLALGVAQDDEFFATRLRVALGISATQVFAERLPVPAGEADWRGNFAIVDALVGRTVERTPPRLEVPPAARAEATEILRGLGLPAGGYVACAAAGFANVRLKTWPAERFGAVLRRLRERQGLRALLVGSEREAEHLEVVRAAAGEAAVWTGGEGQLGRLAALLAESRIFLGNDTGAMHLAAAVGVPVTAVFGGGTWPRFVPAAARGEAVVHPLPCFGCGWDCAFGDAPCLGAIGVDDVAAAAERVLGNGEGFTVRKVDRIAAETRACMQAAAERHRGGSAGHLARQHKLEELTALSREKDGEIAGLKAVCDERERTIFILDGHVRNLQAENAALKADKAVADKTLAALPEDAAKAARTIADQVVHIRNIEALLRHREGELAEARTTAAHRAAGLHDLEQAKHYGRLIAERDTAVHALREGVAARDRLIVELGAGATGPTAGLRKLALAARGLARERIGRPLGDWLFDRVAGDHWMQIGLLRHYDPRPLRWDEGMPGPRTPDADLPRIAVVTPSYGQERFVGRTLRSVLDQAYPKLDYVVQDGGSRDGSPEIIRSQAGRLRHWESAPDKGQADAVRKGFAHLEGRLGADDVMAWLNSDDLLGPGTLRFVGEYFAAHPGVDVIYGHRIIIDEQDREVGRWIMPRHDRATLEWIDYVPQETLFWRKRAWDVAGGIDPSFQFALDWDLLARFQQAGCRIVRVPYFLGAFRVHAEQKTSQAIHTVGAEEMRRIRTRFHGERQDDVDTINRHARHARFWGAVTSRLLEVGIRW